jgi:hypothetical protein
MWPRKWDAHLAALASYSVFDNTVTNLMDMAIAQFSPNSMFQYFKRFAANFLPQAHIEDTKSG